LSRRSSSTSNCTQDTLTPPLDPATRHVNLTLVANHIAVIEDAHDKTSHPSATTSTRCART